MGVCTGERKHRVQGISAHYHEPGTVDANDVVAD